MLITFLKSNKQKQTGFTLIEILVSLLILSIGLLGLAALQLTGMKRNQSAHYRSLAANLAYEIADRIRVNRTTTYTTATGAPGAATNCVTNACNTATMATYDITYWKCSLGGWDTDTDCTGLGIEGDLPSGDGSITPDTPSAGIYRVTVMWDDERTGATGKTCPANPNPANDLTCFTMEFVP
ncbi:MAG: type IV pilus modification protein PilV [Gammaproteobacteria bacterium]|nr:type IV pilus modification protein PilV [Gammaproteobacteria bacterium]